MGGGMNWNNGFSARYYYTLIDPASWRDIERRELTGGTISRSCGGLMQAANIDMTEPLDATEAWIRIWLDARQTDDGTREALFTGLMTTPATSWDGTRRGLKAECYSVLKPADDVLLPRGWYAPAGISGAAIAADLLAIGPAPVEYEENAPTLVNPIVAEDGESNLTMAQKVIAAINWRIRITGDGTINIVPVADSLTASFDSIANDVVELAVTDKQDWFSCPNVFRASSGGLTAVARDESEDSDLSVVNRGREIWKEETNVALMDGESIEEYVFRRLKEEQTPSRSVQYVRRYKPDLYPGDAIRLHYPAQDIDGSFQITSQQIELGYGARTSEDVDMLLYDLPWAWTLEGGAVAEREPVPRQTDDGAIRITMDDYIREVSLL